MFLDRKDLTYIATVHFCGIQVGSLVDGSESMEDRNAKFVYLDFACESDIPAALHFARTTLVESTRPLGAHELILVFYGAHYEAKLMDGIRDCA